MNCEHFGLCGSCTLYDLSYDEQISFKKSFIKDTFLDLYDGKFDVFTSEQKHYRCRAEFKIWHSNEELDYALTSLDKKTFIVSSCKKVSYQIYNLMPILKEYLQDCKTLRYKLFSVQFLSSDNELLVSLIYHKKLDELWEEEAKKLAKLLNIKIVGRSKGVKKVINDDKILENLSINNKNFKFYLNEAAFSQPNSRVNEKMISWASDGICDAKDLLELYCGHGNFTIALSFYFNKVLATEISKTSIKNAEANCVINGVSNIDFIRLSSEELSQALAKKREFFRLRNISLDDFNFSHILVDPPRAGLDELTLNLISKFDNIIYISCNPLSLKENLKSLLKTHKITKFAIFDQFAHTKHIECGVKLSKIMIK